MLVLDMFLLWVAMIVLGVVFVFKSDWVIKKLLHYQKVKNYYKENKSKKNIQIRVISSSFELLFGFPGKNTMKLSIIAIGLVLIFVGVLNIILIL